MTHRKRLGLVVGVLLVIVLMIGVVVVVSNDSSSPLNHIRLAVVPAQDVKKYVGLSETLNISYINQSSIPFALMGLPIVSGIIGSYNVTGDFVNTVLEIYSLELQQGTSARQVFDNAWLQYNESAMITGGYTPHSNGTYKGFRFFVGSVPYQDAGLTGVSYESVGFSGQYIFIISFTSPGEVGPNPGFPQAEINAMLGA
jgi:hypothetical protein